MRPTEEVRESLLQAALTAGPSTWRRLAQLAGVGYVAARRTVENMVRAGVLVVCGACRVPGCNRPVNLYQAAATLG